VYKTAEYLIRKAVRKWLLIGVPVLFGAGFPMHFIFKWSGNFVIAGIFGPVNESVWEHLKLSFWPVIAWWASGYAIIGRNYGLDLKKWVTSLMVALLVCPLAIICFYYTYTGVFGTESVVLDIFSLLLGLSLAHYLAYRIYKYSNPGRLCMYVSFAVIITLAALFTAFTFNPPGIPLFKAPSSGK